MKILFVCRANVGRSQMAQAFFDSLSTHESETAGTMVAELRKEGQTLAGRARELEPTAAVNFVIEVMRLEGLDVSQNVRNQLTPQMVHSADKIVVIEEKASWPDYLLSSDKVLFWDMEDVVDQDLEFTRNTRDELKRRVEELVREVG